MESRRTFLALHTDRRSSSCAVKLVDIASRFILPLDNPPERLFVECLTVRTDVVCSGVTMGQGI